MNSERHYPIAFKLASVALMAFALWAFYKNTDLIVKIYAIIEFFATLNGWAASENDEMEYSDLFLLNDAACSACFFLIILELNEGSYSAFYIYSTILFVLYMLWNYLLVQSGQAKRVKLKRYQICNLIGAVYSFFATLYLRFWSNDPIFAIGIHIVGMFLWAAVLIFWYIDFYIKYFPHGKKNK